MGEFTLRSPKLNKENGKKLLSYLHKIHSSKTPPRTHQVPVHTEKHIFYWYNKLNWMHEIQLPLTNNLLEDRCIITINNILLLYGVQQVDSMLPLVCSVIEDK